VFSWLVSSFDSQQSYHIKALIRFAEGNELVILDMANFNHEHFVFFEQAFLKALYLARLLREILQILMKICDLSMVFYSIVKGSILLAPKSMAVTI
jgi:hypothetical protein